MGATRRTWSSLLWTRGTYIINLSNDATIPSDIWRVGIELIALFEMSTWHASYPDFFIHLRHYSVIGKHFLFAINRTRVRWAVLGLSQDDD